MTVADVAVCRTMTGSGGWPLTIVMSPEKEPFFAATYIPKEARFGMVGLLELIPRITEHWRTDRTQLTHLVQQVLSEVTVAEGGYGDAVLKPGILEETYSNLCLGFDETNGGFGSAPKFPIPHNLLFLLRYWKKTGTNLAVKMVEKTLDAMRSGGIYDHVYGIDVRPLLPVNLDGNEGIVDQSCNCLVLEGLSFHDVAPVARRVADGEEDRFVLFMRFLKGLLTPRVPIYRVVSVLLKIGAFLP